jgi:hypothetical protein
LKIQDTHNYDQNVDIVFKAFIDPNFVKAKYEGIGARNVEIVECSEQGGAHTFETKRELPANVPGLLSKFLGAWNRIEQSEAWQGEAGTSRVGINKIGIVSLPSGISVPVTVTGTQTLRPNGDGCTNDIVFEINCGIPLIGKKLAEFVAGDIQKFMGLEYGFTKNYLSQ